ncbi:MAG: MFS transporter [Burkholderiales bacterium]
MKQQTGLFYGWRIVATCFVIAAFAWSLGLFGSSVYLQSLTVERGWSVATISAAITLFFLVSAAVQRVVGRSIDRWGPRPVLSIGGLSLAGGVALIGQVSSPWQLYPCFALVGIGWSTLSTTGISATVAPWFERHQGRSMTLALMGASLGAIVGVPLLIAALARFGLAAGLLLAALLAVAVLLPLIGTVLRYRNPSMLGLNRDGDSHAVGEPIAPAHRPIANSNNRSRLLWSTTAGFALALTVQIGFITHHVKLAEPVLGTHGAGLLVSAAGVAALIGRLILARIVDRVDVRRLAAGILLLQTGALIAIAAWPSASVLVIASLAYGYGIGHVTTLGPVVVRREFGASAFGATYGTAATVIQLSSAFGPFLLGALRDGFGNYRPGLAIAAMLTSAGCLVLLLGGRREPTSIENHFTK